MTEVRCSIASACPLSGTWRDWARFAVEQRTAVAVLMWWSNRSPEAEVAAVLHDFWHRGAKGTLGWVALIAGAPDIASYTRIGGTLAGVGRLKGGPRWLALGDAGAWAWAAGLTLDEAETQQAAGTLDPAALRTLVMLRGYRLPDVAAVS